jgi:NDP-sugar pyrophosphorylase family protein
MPDNLPPLALLAGGLATRLGTLTRDIPKSLVMVAGEPFLAHQLRLLAKQGIRDVVICCGYLGNQIEDFAGDGSRFGFRIRYSYDSNGLLGTGGALRHALPLLGTQFFVTYGDSYLLADPVHAWNAFHRSSQPAMMSVFRNEDRWDRSNVEMRAGAIRCYGKAERNPGMRHIDYGLSLMQANVLEHEQDGNRFDLAGVFERLASEGRLAAHEVHERFYEIGSPGGLHETEQMLHERYALSSFATAGCEQ